MGFHNGENRSFPLGLLVCALCQELRPLTELHKLFFLMLGSKRIPCALEGSGQVLLSATESSAVQAAPHGWRPGQVEFLGLLFSACPIQGLLPLICEVLGTSPKTLLPGVLYFEEGSLNT